MSKKEVFKISYEGSYCIIDLNKNVNRTINNVINEVTEHLAVGETVVLTKELLTEEELSKLPEFDGF